MLFHNELTNPQADLKKIKDETRKVHLNFRPGCGVLASALVLLFELGVSRACSTRYVPAQVHVQPAVNRQPGYRWKDSDSLPRAEIQDFRKSEKWSQVGPEIKDYVQRGSATSANQATGVGHDVVTT